MSSQFWKRSKPQASALWTADKLHAAIVEYFDWAHSNPLLEAKPFAYKGDSWIEEVDKARPFTLHGVCTFIGVSLKEWAELEKDEELANVCAWASQIIYQQKFELAAVDLLNANFIARDLGIADKKEIGGIAGQPIEVSAREQLLDRLSGIAASLGGEGVHSESE